MILTLFLGLWLQAPLTFEEVLAQAQALPEVRDLNAAQLAEAEAGVVNARTWDNPSFEFTREQIDEAGNGISEDFYTLSQSITRPDLRRKRVAAALLMRDQATLQNQITQLDLKDQVAQLFYGVLHLQQRQVLLNTWFDEMKAQHQRLQAYREEGFISGYELRMLDLQMREAQREAQHNENLYQKERRFLFEWLQLGDPRPLQDTLLPAQQASADSENHPRLRALQASAQAAEARAKASNKLLFSEFTLQAGVKRYQDDFFSDTGWVFGVAVPLPAFNRGQGERAMAQAQARAAKAEAALAKVRFTARERALEQALARQLASYKTYETATLNDANQLVEIAKLGLEEGEFSVSEYLRAMQMRRDAGLALLDMAAEARSVALELNQLRGSYD